MKNTEWQEDKDVPFVTVAQKFVSVISASPVGAQIAAVSLSLLRKKNL